MRFCFLEEQLVNVTYPGVYIEEVPSGVKTITDVPTSTASFFGRSRQGPSNQPIKISSFSDFKRIFGGRYNKNDLEPNVQQFFNNGGSECYIVRLVPKDAEKTNLF